MPNELTLSNAQEIVITEEQQELVKRTIAPDATAAELQLYFYDCTRRGVHPLDRLLHYTKRNGKYTPITSIDLLRMRADATGQHIGTDEPLYQGVRGTPDFAALVRVHKMVAGQKATFSGTARWSEYYPGEKLGFMWQKMPHLMLGKCAEALALRKAFPAQLHGLYVQEEMEQASEPPHVVQSPSPAPDTNTPPENPRPFVWRAGKYKGSNIIEIPSDYLNWYLQNGNFQDHRDAAAKELEFREGQVVLEDVQPDEATDEV